MPAMRLSRSLAVGQLAGVVHPHGGDHGVVVQVVRQLHVLLEERHHAAHGALDVAGGLALLRDHLDDDTVEAAVLLPLDGARPVDPLDEHLDVSVGQLQALHDVRHAAHRVDVLRRGVVGRGVVLRRQEDALVLGEGVLEGARRRGTPDHERHHHVRKDDDVAEGNDGERFVDFHLGIGHQPSAIGSERPDRDDRDPTCHGQTLAFSSLALRVRRARARRGRGGCARGTGVSRPSRSA
jgi:hypothetical protein